MLNQNIIIEHRGYVCENVPVLLRIEHNKYDPEKISCVLHILSDDKKHFLLFKDCLSGDEYGNLKFVCTDIDNLEIYLLGLRGYSLSKRKGILNIYGYEYGISSILIDEIKKIYVTVELTPSGILRKWGSKEFDYDGSIKIKNGYKENIEWQISFGKVKAIVCYEYENHNVYDNKATLQIERPILIYDIDASKLCKHDLKNFIETDVNDLCTILSLCYRKTVYWYEIRFTLEYNKKGIQYPQPLIRRIVSHKTYPDFGDELIEHRHLINGGLYNLLSSFRNSNQLDSLRRSISFLSSSESDNAIEIKYFLCIISLESFCDGYVENNSKALKIPSGKWKHIEKTIRDSLSIFSEKPDYLKIIERIKKKLPELKSITTIDKILYCCKDLNVITDDLWVNETFEEGLLRSLSMRNHLFHRAYCDAPFELYKTLIRLQILTERLLLKHLNWPDEQVWTWYDQKLRRVNSGT